MTTDERPRGTTRRPVRVSPWVCGEHVRDDGTIDPSVWTDQDGHVDEAAYVSGQAMQRTTTALVAKLGRMELDAEDRNVLAWLARREEHIVSVIGSWLGRARPVVEAEECARRMDMLVGKLQGVDLNEGDWLFIEQLTAIGVDEVAHLARLFALVYVAGARSVQADGRPSD